MGFVMQSTHVSTSGEKPIRRPRKSHPHPILVWTSLGPISCAVDLVGLFTLSPLAGWWRGLPELCGWLLALLGWLTEAVRTMVDHRSCGRLPQCGYMIDALRIGGRDGNDMEGVCAYGRFLGRVCTSHDRWSEPSRIHFSRGIDSSVRSYQCHKQQLTRGLEASV